MLKGTRKAVRFVVTAWLVAAKFVRCANETLLQEERLWLRQ
jgi:hypothetical protein